MIIVTIFKIVVESSNLLGNAQLVEEQSWGHGWGRISWGCFEWKCLHICGSSWRPPSVNFTKILQAAFVPKLFYQNVQSQSVMREKLCRTLLYKKTARKMLVKLTPCWWACNRDTRWTGHRLFCLAWKKINIYVKRYNIITPF